MTIFPFLLIIFSFTFPVVCYGAVVYPRTSWETRTPQQIAINKGKLQEVSSFISSKGGGDGIIIYKGYNVWTWANINTKGNIASAAKSFTSTILGLAIDDGKCSLNQKVTDFDNSLTGKDRNITFFHFTTMTSGYGMSSNPGASWYYNDEAMNKFADILDIVWNEPIQNVLKRRIMDPIGANNWSWSGGGAGNDSTFQAEPEDLARFGWLFANQGNWNGQQLISASWVEEAHKDQVSVSGMDVYGFNWWTNANPSQGWPDVPQGAFGAFGYNGQYFVFVFPERELVGAHRGPYEMETVSEGEPGENNIFRTIIAALLTETSRCTSFTYNAWGTCQSNNTQTRTVATQSPTGCTGGSPILLDLARIPSRFHKMGKG